jgi:peptidoglycan DL-endopeptidase LytE
MKYGFRIFLVCIVLLITPSLVLASKTHRVKKNESLYTIAKKYHVPVADLKVANNLVSTHIKNGDVLIIPPHTTTASAEAHTKNGKLKGDAYKVKKGDSLARIAEKTGVSVKELKRLNALAKGKVKPGRVLV